MYKYIYTWVSVDMCSYINVCDRHSHMQILKHPKSPPAENIEEKESFLRMYACMYVFISLFSQLHRSVNLGKKKYKHFCLMPFVKWKNPWSSGKDVPSEHCARKVLPSSVHALSVHHSRLLNAELLRFDLRDPNIDIFTVPLTM